MKFLTFLNSGCLDICRNMLISAYNVGIDLDDFYIACLDENAYEILKHYKNAYLYKNIELHNYQNWTFDKDSGFRRVVENKWKIISEIYKLHPNLIWVDTDIVFRRDPRPILNSSNILFQGDYPGSTLCSGFMVLNDTDACKKLVQECANLDGQDDQLVVNEIALTKYKQNVQILDYDTFPNGYTYYTLGKKDKAYIVHNNWMKGIDEKTKKFKEEGLWYL